MSSFILSIDAGTTGVQTSIFDFDTLAMCGNHKIEFPQIYPKPGFVEHKPQDIWSAFLNALSFTLQKAAQEWSHFATKNIVAIGLSNQRETCLAWNKHTGEVAGNAIVWQDKRTAEFCSALKNNPQTSRHILNSTGLVCDPYFSASKMSWLLKHHPETKKWQEKKELALGTIDSYLIWKLSEGATFATEHTNASRTMLYNIQNGAYDNELLTLFGIPMQALPQILPSSGHFASIKNIPGLQDGLPITGVLGDQQSALFGHNCTGNGQVKVTFGTGAFLLMNVGNTIPISTQGLLTTVAHSQGTTRTFALEGGAFIAGAAVQFLRDNLAWVKNSADSAEIALSAPRDEDVMFVPALAGLNAPYWNPRAKGVLFGLTRGTQKAQIIRAVLESIAFQNVQILKLMETAYGQKMSKIAVDGGAAKNNFLMQFQADMLQANLLRPFNTETTSLGAAKAAKLGILGAISCATQAEEYEKTFQPQMPPFIANAYYYKWTKATECVNSFYQTTP